MGEKSITGVRKRTKRKYSLPEAKLKLEKEIQVLKAFVEHSDKGEKAVSYRDIRGVANKASVSSELAFFADAGLAVKEKGSKYVPTKKVIEFVKHAEWDEEGAKNILKQILLNTWFGELTKKILKTTGHKKLKDLIKELGITAEADNKKDEKAIRRLIEWLEYAGIVEIDGNEDVSLKDDINSSQIMEVEHPSSKSIEHSTESNSCVTASMEERKINVEALGNTSIKINVNINMQIDQDIDIGKFEEIIEVIQRNLLGNKNN